MEHKTYSFKEKYCGENQCPTPLFEKLKALQVQFTAMGGGLINNKSGNKKECINECSQKFQTVNFKAESVAHDNNKRGGDFYHIFG